MYASDLFFIEIGKFVLQMEWKKKILISVSIIKPTKGNFRNEHKSISGTIFDHAFFALLISFNKQDVVQNFLKLVKIPNHFFFFLLYR